MIRPFLLDEAFSREQALLMSPGQFHCWPRPDGTLRVERADPVVWCTGQLLSMLHLGDCHPDVSLECSLYTGECSLDTSAPIGDIIRIATPERQYVYVITRQVTVHDAIWEAQWPD